MLAPLSDHQLLVFWVQFGVLLSVARAFGFLARRVRQPAVVGELLAGIVLGPSVLGALAPEQAAWLFPADAVQAGLITAVAWIGLVLLLTATGLQVDLPLVRRLARRSALIPVGAFVLPLALGFGLGMAVPDAFLADAANRPLFAGFIAVALTVSSLPMIARVLLDMGLLRRDVGQITVVAAMADDLGGWLLLGMLSGIATTGAIDAGDAGTIAIGVLVFVVVAFTLGQRVVDVGLRASLRLTDGIAGAFSVAMVTVLTAAALTHWIGTDAVLGAFIAGILLGRSPFRRPEVRHGVELLSTAVFAPIFFASAGMLLDLGVLTRPTVASWALFAVVVATLGKLGGSYLGARLGKLDPRTGLAIGLGLNARGAMGIVAATVALSAGVFNEVAYTTIVLISVITSMAVPVTLRAALSRAPVDADEAERLRHEALFGSSVTVNATRILLPSRGGVHSRVAARITDLVMSPSTSVTVMSVGEDRGEAEDVVATVAELLGSRSVTPHAQLASDPARAILHELRGNYDMLVVGASHHVQGPTQMTETLQRLLVESTVPVMLVRGAEPTDAGLRFRRLVTPATGTRVGRAAEEITYLLGARTGAEVDVVHVVTRSDQVLVGRWGDSVQSHPVARSLLDRSLALARRFGTTARAVTRVASNPYDEFLLAADERGADTLVVATRIRVADDRPFLGHGIEFLLRHAKQNLIVLAFPPDVLESAASRSTDRPLGVHVG